MILSITTSILDAETPPAGDILIVDDTPANLRLLSEMLVEQNYKVRTAPDGSLALASAQAIPPDLILLDIKMPNMSGYEVCEQLKADPRTCDIPIIFISALDQTEDKVKAFTLGGVDYVTKPFQVEEVLARVQTHLSIREMHLRLNEQNKQLRESEEKYRSLTANLPVGVYRTSIEGQILFANPALIQMLGYDSLSELQKTTAFSRYLDPIEREQQLEAWKAQRDIVQQEITLQRKDGNTIWVRDIGRIIFAEDGEIVHIEGILEDITERKQAKKKADEVEQRYRALFEQNNDAVVITSLDGIVIDVNPQVKNKWDIEPGRIISNHLETFVAPEDLEDMVRRGAALRSGEDVPIFECQLVDKDGRIILAEINSTLVYDPEGNPTHVHSIFRDVTARREAERALEAERKLLRTVIDNVPAEVYVKDNESRFVLVNNEAARALKVVSPADCIGKTDFDFMPEEMAARFGAAEQAIIQTGQPLREEQIGTDLEGRQLWKISNKLLLCDAEGNSIGIVGIGVDITERKKAEDALRESLTTTQTLYDASRILIELKDLPDLLQVVVDNLVIALPANRVALITVDHDRDRVSQFVHSGPGSHHIVRVPFDELRSGLTGWVLREGKPVLSPKGTHDPRESAEVQRRRLETDCGDIIVVPLQYRGEMRGTLTAINRPQDRDFTQQDVDLMVAIANQAAIAIENAQLIYSLRKSEEKFFKAFRANPDPMIISSLVDDRYIDVNESFTTATGYTREEAIGRTSAELQIWADPEDRVRYLQTVQEHGAVRNLEVSLRRKSGEIGQALMASEVVEIDNERCLLTVSIDITERNRAEQQRLELAVERERMQILSNFVTEASHEFKTPLSIINTNTYLLGKTTDPDKQGQQIRQIKNQVESITALVDALTLMTKLDSVGQDLSLAEINLNEIIGVVYHGMRSAFQERNLECVLELSKRSLLLQGNSGYLTSALQHIVDNAIRYSHEGGTITIRSDHREGTAVVKVLDTGDGISDEDLPRIFERFYRSDKAGTTRGFGLGLPIAKAIIKLHQGSVEVESEVGQGSTFRILLPMA
jgi:PAS domain S-box-containing protein